MILHVWPLHDFILFNRTLKSERYKIFCRDSRFVIKQRTIKHKYMILIKSLEFSLYGSAFSDIKYILKFKIELNFLKYSTRLFSFKWFDSASFVSTRPIAMKGTDVPSNNTDFVSKGNVIILKKTAHVLYSM